MDTLANIRFAFRRNLPLWIGVCLCLYFSYHIVSGQRSYFHLSQLNLSLQQKAYTLSLLEQKHQDMEKKVMLMRPNSLSIDMLEEQIRLLLGYNLNNEILVVDN